MGNRANRGRSRRKGAARKRRQRIAKVKQYYLKKIESLKDSIARSEFLREVVERLCADRAVRIIYLQTLVAHPWKNVWASLTVKLRRIARKEGR